MLILGQSFPPPWDGRPPGMTHEDWPIWMVWRQAGIITDDCYFYNVRIGSPVPAPAGAPNNYRRQWELASLYRIDALGVSPGAIHVYEVKHEATPQSLWQLNTYCSLLKQEFGSLLTCSPWLIAESTVLGTLAQAVSLKIRVWTLNSER